MTMTPLAAIRFVVPGEPVAKGRPRFRNVRTRAGHEFVQTYTPAKTRHHEASVAFEAKLAMAGRAPFSGPVVLIVNAYFAIPASWPKWQKREARTGLVVPVGRPDWDNIGKACSDALNCVVYRDDSLVVDVAVRKRYSLEPRIEIEVRMFNPLRATEPELLETIGSEA